MISDHLEDNSLITLKDYKEVYLQEDLNLSKMHAIYLESQLGESCSRVSYR